MKYRKIPFVNSKQLLQRFELSSEEAEALVNADMTPEQLITVLTDAGEYIDLTQFLCHALPVREVIWWCCLALELRNDVWTDAQQAAIKNARAWVREPDEAKRRLAEQQAEKLGNENGPGWLAQAVFWNGSGSLSEVGMPAVMPADFLYAKAAAGAINLAAALPEWQGRDKFYQRVFAMGLNIADGGNGQID